MKRKLQNNTAVIDLEDSSDSEHKASPQKVIVKSFESISPRKPNAPLSESQIRSALSDRKHLLSVRHSADPQQSVRSPTEGDVDESVIILSSLIRSETSKIDDPAVLASSLELCGTLSEADLVRLQSIAVNKLSSLDTGVEASGLREMLGRIQKLLLTVKMNKVRKAEADRVEKQARLKETLRVEENSDDVKGFMTRAGTSATSVVYRRIYGSLPSELTDDKRTLNFTLKVGFGQIAARVKEASCVLVLLPGDQPEALESHVEYFRSRERAGVANVSEGQIFLVPPGPLARTVVGPEALAADPRLSKAAVALLLK